jgi:ABC-type dipeptide/oligopeptide/nickel transport system permease subunit
MKPFGAFGTTGGAASSGRSARRQPGALFGGAVVTVVVLCALLAPWLAPYPPNEISLGEQLQPPSPAHPLGTDFYGRDLLSRLLYGARATLGVAALAVGIAVVVGMAVGLAAGWSRGWLAQGWVALIDLALAFPALLLALLVVALLGAGLSTLAIAVGIAGIPTYARVVRSIGLSTRSAVYVEAARSMGAGAGHILRRHLWPNAIEPAIAMATADLGRVILYVAALGFLGLGAAPPQAEWGLMLYEGRQYLATAPWASMVPGLAIALTIVAVTLLGDAISGARRDRHP